MKQWIILGVTSFSLTFAQSYTVSYTVQKGDTLSSISRNYNVGLAEIRQSNSLETDTLSIGQVIEVPVDDNFPSYPEPIPQPSPPKTTPPQPPKAGRIFQSGMASWYGPGFQGRKTASGASFNMYALTAAHPTLKFGTKVRVTNIKTGLSVVVTINDRGPYAHGRIIDLSKAAAQTIRLSGLAQVRLELID